MKSRNLFFMNSSCTHWPFSWLFLDLIKAISRWRPKKSWPCQITTSSPLSNTMLWGAAFKTRYAMQKYLSANQPLSLCYSLLALSAWHLTHSSIIVNIWCLLIWHFFHRQFDPNVPSVWWQCLTFHKTFLYLMQILKEKILNFLLNDAGFVLLYVFGINLRFWVKNFMKEKVQKQNKKQSS